MNAWLTGVVAAILLLAQSGAFAQGYAPQGNEHPESTYDETPDASRENPFGPMLHNRDGSASAAERLRAKADFASRVDLSPLRDLAVFHDGRVKILDTLAREVMADITGRQGYFDLIQRENGAERFEFDPLFTLLDLSIDRHFYADRPLVRIGYLPLRRSFVERALPIEPGTSEAEAERIEQARDRFLRLGRIPPIWLEWHQQELYARYEFSDPYRSAFSELGRAARGLMNAPAMFKVVAPPTEDRPWKHLSDDFSRADEVRPIALALGDAWRNHDAEGVNAAAQRLAEILPTIHPEVYPGTRRSLEMLYNNTNAFVWGYWIYAFSFVTLLLAFGTQRTTLKVLGMAMLFAAIGLHAFGFVLRCIIAERFAIQNQFESMIGVSLFGSLAALGLMFWRKQLLFGAAAAAAGFLVLITATEARIPGVAIGREAAILNTSVLLKYHVTIVLTSYGLITIGFITSLFYLVGHYAKRFGAGEAPALAAALSDGAPVEKAKASSSRVLRDLDRATMIVLQLAFWTLGVGILLGAWWADHSWGRWWAFDPKETWALITWIVYLIVIHVRMVVQRRELVTAWLSVIGFFVMLWTYFGVNLLLPGLHAYA